jgi:hypothetical protein
MEEAIIYFTTSTILYLVADLIKQLLAALNAIANIFLKSFPKQ